MNRLLAPLNNPEGWRRARMAMCTSGIIASLLLYAYLQERIMATPQGRNEQGEPVFFRDSLFLVLQNRLCAALAAAVVMAVRRQWDGFRCIAPLYKYASVSVSNVVATSAQYSALVWVSMPAQTLGKCAKMIPVLVWGTLMSGKRYGWMDYGVATAVAIGCTVFLLSGNIHAKHSDAGSSWIGLALMVVYLAFDGFTSTFQEKLFRGYTMSAYNQMLYVNLTSAAISLFGLLVSNRLWADLRFGWQHPQFLRDTLTLSLSAVSAQFFITFTIKEFGALLYATVMTTRQFLTIFLSNILFAHAMSGAQWLGTAMVFGALYWKTYIHQWSKKSPSSSNSGDDHGASHRRHDAPAGVQRPEHRIAVDRGSAAISPISPGGHDKGRP
ncbi:hypothetical protein CDCA_CDCA03G0908 [Cyanidium caldarium]|uniref:UDP-galactose transporter n=1 Tax=Cyanidium caldarium TaxID=2771 RepID=A0AAV9IRK1_CYACA|nr:hypothetical protein CDCA_CDCA03G0908 [Cyanidium caldarium]